MKSKQYIDLQESMGYLIDTVNDMGGIIDSLDESETEEYEEIKRKIEGLYADAEEIKKSL